MMQYPNSNDNAKGQAKVAQILTFCTVTMVCVLGFCPKKTKPRKEKIVMLHHVEEPKKKKVIQQRSCTTDYLMQ